MKSYNYELNKDGYLSVWSYPADLTKPIITVDDNYDLNEFTKVDAEGNVTQDLEKELDFIKKVDDDIRAYNEIVKVNAEIDTLTKWFEWYDTQIIQYERSKRLGIAFNNDITSLDTLALVNANKLKKLRNSLI